ncbi:MAG: 2,3-bisphosphoglycerate-independent phosphoglycerate mutase [Cytophagales bacterium]|nr:2,3-bisphosphoglycerate-independent phosphoglycerate mutase [Cytophagales bacterium]
MSNSPRKILLVVLDGWGQTPEAEAKVSAIAQANTPFIDQLYLKYPCTLLETSGTCVGLPKGHMGNSEVGHLHLGAGRKIPQELLKIQQDIQHGSFYENPLLKESFQKIQQAQQNKLHFIALTSKGGVHGHIDHLFSLCQMAEQYQVPFYVHAISDGRDVAPQDMKSTLPILEKRIKQYGGFLATLMGRYYAMDRDKRWERTRLAYEALIKRKGIHISNPSTYLKDCYKRGITDEYLRPAILLPEANISSGDVIICTHFRPDRIRQLTQALSQKKSPLTHMNPPSVHFLGFTSYNPNFENVQILYPKKPVPQTMGEILTQENKYQTRIAETEKYPHVTFFFSGGQEKPFPKEKRIFHPSPKISTYDLKPEMSAEDLKTSTCQLLKTKTQDFILLNFANADMVGHTGNMKATQKACEVVDQCLSEVIQTAQNAGYTAMVLADHGNAECMQTPEGTPHTAHTNYPVPCFLIPPTPGKAFSILPRTGKLSQIAPTLLSLMKIPIPKEMDPPWKNKN